MRGTGEQGGCGARRGDASPRCSARACDGCCCWGQGASALRAGGDAVRDVWGEGGPRLGTDAVVSCHLDRSPAERRQGSAQGRRAPPRTHGNSQYKQVAQRTIVAARREGHDGRPVPPERRVAARQVYPAAAVPLGKVQLLVGEKRGGRGESRAPGLVRDRRSSALARARAPLQARAVAGGCALARTCGTGLPGIPWKPPSTARDDATSSGCGVMHVLIGVSGLGLIGLGA